jgi:hypothetical protein
MSVTALPRNETSATRSVLVPRSGESVVTVPAFAGASVIALIGAPLAASIGALAGLSVIGVLLLVGLLLLALLITTGCGPPN